LEHGAEFIATGHYAKVVGGSWYMVDGKKEFKEEPNNLQPTNYYLQRAKDDNKDQTYFLYRITERALAKTLFPLGGLYQTYGS